MDDKKAFKQWIVNVISFVLVVVIGVTGLVNWLVLPKGYEARWSILGYLRHFFIEVHQWTGMIFLFVILAHVLLHRSYITSNLRKRGIVRSKRGKDMQI